MDSQYPTADQYAAEQARYAARTPVDIMGVQRAITDAYSNTVLLDVGGYCMRLAVFEEEYRWHHHPDSDELFLVVEGLLEIDFQDGSRERLAPWQCLLVPAHTVHRTRAIGRTVNLTFEKRSAQTIFV